MYAKLVLTPDGKKEYHPINEYDLSLYSEAAIALARSVHSIPEETIVHGYNTKQVLNYGFQSWDQMFNARQLFSISTLGARIKEIGDNSLRDAFTCLLSGALEFNNMFASYKGEGTGAVRHMFYHHILKPERTPLEANIWGDTEEFGIILDAISQPSVASSPILRTAFRTVTVCRGIQGKLLPR